MGAWIMLGAMFSHPALPLSSTALQSPPSSSKNILPKSGQFRITLSPKGPWISVQRSDSLQSCRQKLKSFVSPHLPHFQLQKVWSLADTEEPKKGQKRAVPSRFKMFESTGKAFLISNPDDSQNQYPQVRKLDGFHVIAEFLLRQVQLESQRLTCVRLCFLL